MERRKKHTFFSIDPITSAADGWGDRHYPNKQRLVSHKAAVRVLAWTFDNAPNRCRWTWNERTTINDASQDTPRMIFPGTKNPREFIVLVTVRLFLLLLIMLYKERSHRILFYTAFFFEKKHLISFSRKIKLNNHYSIVSRNNIILVVTRWFETVYAFL